jgi:hypothetical protein
MNSIERWRSKKSIGVVLILAAMLIVAVCGFTSNLLAAKATSLDQTRAFTVLNHSPMGTAGLLWSQANHTLIATVILTGLAPGSTHPAAIHNGTNGGCSTPTHGDVVYGLNPVTADSTGKGASVTTVQNVPMGIPAQGWYIDVHNGPQLADDRQQERTACANIINTNALISAPPPTTPNNPTTSNQTKISKTPSTTHGVISTENPPAPPAPPSDPSIPSSITSSNQVVNVSLGPSADNDQSVTVGGVELAIRNRRGNSSLVVKIFLFRLTPNSTHMAHIHSGSCENQGPVVHKLNPVHADAVGFGTSTTTLNDVSSIPNTGWYVNVHRGATMDELGDQTGFDPIACGNISTPDSTLSSPSTIPTVTPTPFIE